MVYIWSILLLFVIVASIPPSCRASDDDGDLDWFSGASRYYLANNTKDYKWDFDFLVDLGETLVRSLGPKEIHWDTFIDIFTGKADLEEALKQLIEFELPVLIIFVILMLLAFLLPIAGLFFCCCRCCGNCGGTRKEEEISELSRCYLYMMSPFIVVICMLIGLCTFLDKPIESKLIKSSFDLAYTTLYFTYDIETYSGSIVKDLNELAYDDFDSFTDTIMNKLEHADEEISNPLIRQTVSHLDAISDDVDKFIDELEVVTIQNEIFGKINDTIYRIVKGSEDLDNTMDMVATNLTDIKNDCLADLLLSGLGVCNAFPDPSSLDVSFDLSLQLISISLDPLFIFDSANSTLNSVFNLLNKANASMSDIPEAINTKMLDLRSIVNSSLSNIGRTIKKRVDKTTAALDVDFRELLQVELIEMGLWKLEQQRSQLESYAAATWAFVIAFIIFTTAASLFLIGSNFTLICGGLQDLTIIEEVVDNPAIWSDGQHPLANMMGNTNVTFYSLLEQCSEDVAITGILGVTIVDPSSLDIRGEITVLDDLAIVINDFFSKLSFSDIDIKLQIEGLREQFMPVNVTDQLSTMSNAAASMDLNTMADDIESQAAALTGLNPDMAKSLEGLATYLRKIQDQIIDVIANDTVLLQDQLEKLNSSINTLMGKTYPITNSVGELLKFKDNEAGSLVLETIDTFMDGLVTMAENFMHEKVNRVNNEIGRCGIIRLIYDSLVNGICEDLMAGITLGWMSVSVFSLCLLPFIYFNIKVSKYHRRTKPSTRHTMAHQQHYLPPPGSVKVYPQAGGFYQIPQ